MKTTEEVQQTGLPSLLQIRYLMELEKVGWKRGTVMEIAGKCGVSHPAVSRYLKSCCEKGILNEKYEFTTVGKMMLDRYRKEIPLMADYQPEEGTVPTNSQVYRVYIERYLCSLPVVNQDLDLIISQKEATMYGVPIQVYFFSRNKIWKEYERIQSDIFDHLLAMVPKFDLKVYQYSD